MSHDPVCNMEVDQEEASSYGLVSEVETRQFYFCSPECKQEFDRSPSDYITPELWQEAENTSPDDFAQG